MDFQLTSGNVDDRAVVEEMAKNLKGWLFGDRGYISQKLKDLLISHELELVTKVKRNMKEKIIEPIKKYPLRTTYPNFRLSRGIAISLMKGYCGLKKQLV